MTVARTEKVKQHRTDVSSMEHINRLPPELLLKVANAGRRGRGQIPQANIEDKRVNKHLGKTGYASKGSQIEMSLLPSKVG